jgi:ferredoxin, 2Fe-2S
MKIKCLPGGEEFDVNSEKSLLLNCLDNGIHINSICKGVPKCGECRIKIKDGEHNVLPPAAKEMAILGNNWFLDGRRLSCQVRVFGDLSIDISEQIERDQLAHKKVRGFRDSKSHSQASRAKLDTFVLQETQQTGNASSSAATNANSGKK